VRLRKDALEIAQLSATRTLAMDEAGAAIARQLNGPLTALLLYMGEIKQHSHQFSQSAGERFTCSRWWKMRFSKRARLRHDEAARRKSRRLRCRASRKGVYKTRAGQAGDGVRTPGVMFASNSARSLDEAASARS